MQPEANPIQHTTLLNNAMKNPHLVETQLYVYPDTGKEIQSLPTNLADWASVRQQKAKGEIPMIELNFNIQGVPLLLTTQSFLTIRFKLKGFTAQLSNDDLRGRLPEDYCIDTSGWPKLNSQVINQAGTTLSNFQLQNYYPFFLNYIRHLQFSHDVDRNSRQSYNDNILETFVMKAQNNSLVRLTYPRGRNEGLDTTSIRHPISDSPFSFSSIFTEEVVQNQQQQQQQIAGRRYYMNVPDWEFDLRIPIAEIIPAFQVPVIPLAQTNTSSIQLRVLLNSPMHMFFLPGSIRPRGVSLKGGEPLSNLNFIDIDDHTNENIQAINAQGQVVPLQLTSKTALGLDKALLESVSYPSALSFVDQPLNPLDYWNGTVECFLNLKVLANPLLNPLVGEYIKPFINEMNEFKASFADSFYFGQLLHFRGQMNEVLSFEFRPSQLFYNATHVGVFFASPYKNQNENQQMLTTENRFTSLQGYVSHGYYTLPPEFELHNFQVGLGSSCVPLYDRPLNYNDLIQSTIDCFKKYGANEMLGQIVQDESRFRTGDAFVLLDLTHTRGAGYFIDADNMITVRGSITHHMGRESLLQVNLIVFYQNSLTVLLDLDGAVLVQQT